MMRDFANKFNKFSFIGAQTFNVRLYISFITKITFNSQFSDQNIKISPLEKVAF